MTDAWTIAVQEKNWATFCVTALDPTTGKTGKYPTLKDGHVGAFWGQPCSIYHAARFTLAEAQDVIAKAVPVDGVTHYAIGYLPRPGSSLTVGDLDACRDPVSGVIQPWAQDIIAKGETYVEVSTSGTGLRVLMERQDGDDQHNSSERHDCGFFANGGKGAILTFKPLDGTSVPVRAAPALRDAILQRRGISMPRDPNGRQGEDFGEVSLDLLRSVVRAVSNDGTRWRYSDWINLGHAIQTVDDGPEGYKIFSEYSERWPGKKTESIDRKWERGLDANGDLGFATLVWMARESNGGEMPNDIEVALGQAARDNRTTRALTSMPVVDAGAVVTQSKQAQKAAMLTLATAALPAAEGDAALIRTSLCELIGASPVMVDTN